MIRRLATVDSPAKSMRPRVVALLLGLTLIAAACTSSDQAADAPVTTSAPTTEAPTTQAPTTEAEASETTTADTGVELPPIPETLPLPEGDAPASTAEIGPYAVGRRSIQVNDPARERDLVIDVWYPVDPETSGEFTTYTFIPGVALPSDMALDAVPASADGPFPLVVYSHGSGGQSYIASFFTEHLASHGFVVAAPEHAGNTALDTVLGSTSRPSLIAVDRPLDVSFTIDQLLAATDEAGGDLAGLVDAGRIGVTGHSFGGYTAYAVAAGLPPEGLEDPPVRENDVRADERVDAIVAMAPVSSFLPDSSLGSITIPSMVITGTEDATTPLDPQSTNAFQVVRSGYAYRVDLEGAGHQSFTDVCDYQVAIPSIEGIPQQLIDFVDEFAQDGCQPTQMSAARAQELTNQYVVAFFRAHVAGDDLYRLSLTEETAAADTDVVFFSR